MIVKSIDRLADTLRRAFKIAKSGRPGPVLVDVTKDVTAVAAWHRPRGYCDRGKGYLLLPKFIILALVPPPPADRFINDIKIITTTLHSMTGSISVRKMLSLETLFIE